MLNIFLFTTTARLLHKKSPAGAGLSVIDRFWAYQTVPCAIIESATFTNPPMFDPFT